MQLLGCLWAIYYSASKNKLSQKSIVFIAVPMTTPSLLSGLNKQPATPRTGANDADDDVDLDSSMNTEGVADSENQPDTQNETDNQTVLRLLEEGEKVNVTLVHIQTVKSTLEVLVGLE